MAKSKHWTYFNDEFKHRKVDEFCAWYLHGNSDKVRTKTIKRRPPTDKEIDARISRYCEAYGVEVKDRGRTILTPSGYSPPPLPNLSESVVDSIEDERFKNLKSLVYQYAGITKQENENRERLIQELWSIVGILEDEKRIDEGKGYQLETYEESQIARLDAKIANLTQRIDNTDTFLKTNHPAYQAFLKSRKQ